MNKNRCYDLLKEMGFSPNTIVDCGAAWGEWSSLVKNKFPEATVIGIDANQWTPYKIPGTDITEIVLLSDTDYKKYPFYRKKEHNKNSNFQKLF